MKSFYGCQAKPLVILRLGSARMLMIRCLSDHCEHCRRVRLIVSLRFVFVVRVRVGSEFSITFSRTRSQRFLV